MLIRRPYKLVQEEGADPKEWKCWMPVSGLHPVVIIVNGEALVIVSAHPNALCDWHNFLIVPCDQPFELMIGQDAVPMSTKAIPHPTGNGVVILNVLALRPWPGDEIEAVGGHA